MMEKQIDHILEPLFSWWNGFGTLTAPCDFEDAGEESKSRLRELLSGEGDELEPMERWIYEACRLEPDFSTSGDAMAECRARINTRRAAELAELEALITNWDSSKVNDDGLGSDIAFMFVLLSRIIDKRKGKDAQDDDGYHQIQECGGCGEMYIISLIETCRVCDRLLCTDCLPKEKHECWEEVGK